jgi:Methyltransferase domain
MQLSLTESFWHFLEWAYNDQNDSFIKQWRTQRFRSFIECVNPPKQARILDLGGSSYIWELMPHDFHITIVNLPDNQEQSEHDSDRYTYIEGDATNLKEIFADQSFDVVFSNSVIEHVGDEAQQIAFASEVQRLGKAYWIQTPSDRFPLEVHTGMPFYWSLPCFVQNRLKKSWRDRNPNWAAMVEGTRVLPRRKMQELFNDAAVFVEHKLMFEKSYAVYRSF